MGTAQAVTKASPKLQPSLTKFVVTENYFSSALKFSLKTSDLILKGILLVVFVGNDEGQSGIFLEVRDFTCWRDREFNDKYSCRVSGLGENGVQLDLDIVSIRFANPIAEEIARCLYDAVLISVGNLAGFVPTPAARDCVLERKYRKIVSGKWSYAADGQFSCHGSESEVYFVELSIDANDATEQVGVYTVDEGGVELVFEFMCYSFSMLDAVWLANGLMEAAGGETLDVLETTSVSCMPLAGLFQRAKRQKPRYPGQ